MFGYHDRIDGQFHCEGRHTHGVRLTRPPCLVMVTVPAASIANRWNLCVKIWPVPVEFEARYRFGIFQKNDPAAHAGGGFTGGPPPRAPGAKTAAPPSV